MLEPVNFPNAILVEACDIPADMTIAEWRRGRRAATVGQRPRLRFWRARA
jgi:hypothetical protein